MKIIHQNGYSNEELLTWKLTIFKNIIESIQSIVAAVQKFNYQFETMKDQVRSKLPPFFLLTLMYKTPIFYICMNFFIVCTLSILYLLNIKHYF